VPAVIQINQGMDDRNERLVFSRIVQSCCRQPSDPGVANSTPSRRRLEDSSSSSSSLSSSAHVNIKSSPNSRDSHASDDTKPQYFLVSPKLLQGLKALYNDDVTVLLVLNGPGLIDRQPSARHARESGHMAPFFLEKLLGALKMKRKRGDEDCGVSSSVTSTSSVSNRRAAGSLDDSFHSTDGSLDLDLSFESNADRLSQTKKRSVSAASSAPVPALSAAPVSVRVPVSASAGTSTSNPGRAPSNPSSAKHGSSFSSAATVQVKPEPISRLLPGSSSSSNGGKSSKEVIIIDISDEPSPPRPGPSSTITSWASSARRPLQPTQKSRDDGAVVVLDDEVDIKTEKKRSGSSSSSSGINNKENDNNGSKRRAVAGSPIIIDLS
jgi:hypothetical protein